MSIAGSRLRLILIRGIAVLGRRRLPALHVEPAEPHSTQRGPSPRHRLRRRVGLPQRHPIPGPPPLHTANLDLIHYKKYRMFFLSFFSGSNVDIDSWSRSEVVAVHRSIGARSCEAGGGCAPLSSRALRDSILICFAKSACAVHTTTH